MSKDEILRVVTYNDNILTQKSEEVKEINKEIRELIKKMFKTMYYSNGIGLAAVQVGVLKRIFVMDVPDQGAYEMINPVIIDQSDETSTCEEGCLSLPGIANEVIRSKSVVVEYYDADGNKKSLEATGLLATCIQHEYDHLNGTLFIDRLPPEIKLKKLKEYNNLHIV